MENCLVHSVLAAVSLMVRGGRGRNLPGSAVGELLREQIFLSAQHLPALCTCISTGVAFVDVCASLKRGSSAFQHLGPAGL